MVFVNEWPVPNDIEKARTVDHERNAELFRHHGYYHDDGYWVIEWRLSWNGKDTFITGNLRHKSVCDDGSIWTPQNKREVIDSFAYYNIEYIRMPISLKNNSELYQMIDESIKVNKFCSGKPTSKVRSVDITGLETASVQFYPG